MTDTVIDLVGKITCDSVVIGCCSSHCVRGGFMVGPFLHDVIIRAFSSWQSSRLGTTPIPPRQRFCLKQQPMSRARMNSEKLTIFILLQTLMHDFVLQVKVHGTWDFQCATSLRSKMYPFGRTRRWQKYYFQKNLLEL